DSGATYLFEGDGVNGDLVNVGGLLPLNDNWILKLEGVEEGGSVTIFTFGSLYGGSDLNPIFDSSALAFTPTLSLEVINNTIVLHGVSIPEPSVVMLAALGLTVVLFFRRRRSA